MRELFWFAAIFLGANKSDVFTYVGTGATPISEMLFKSIWRRDESLFIVFRVIKSFCSTKAYLFSCATIFCSVCFRRFKEAHKRTTTNPHIQSVTMTIHFAFCILRFGMCGRVSEWASAWWLIVLVYEQFATTYVTTANKRESTLQ